MTTQNLQNPVDLTRIIALIVEYSLMRTAFCFASIGWIAEIAKIIQQSSEKMFSRTSEQNELVQILHSVGYFFVVIFKLLLI